MAFTCEECGSRTSGAPNLTVTGRELCGDCYQVLLGLSAGMLAGGGPGESVATAGVLVRFQEWRRRRRSR